MEFPTWTVKGGQDDIVKDERSIGIISNDKVSFHVSTKDHNKETGLYITHIYAYDSNGKKNGYQVCSYISSNNDPSIIPIKEEIFNGHRYLLFDGSIWSQNSRVPCSWEYVSTYGQSLGGHLVTINSLDENLFVKSLISDLQKSCIIGLNDIEREGLFVWDSGEDVEYSNWASGQPDNYNNEDFGTIQLDGSWNDSNDVSECCFICEIVGSIGDVNQDSFFDIQDAQLAKRIAMKVADISEYTSEGFAAGDLDRNGKITINEARKIGSSHFSGGLATDMRKR